MEEAFGRRLTDKDPSAIAAELIKAMSKLSSEVITLTGQTSGVIRTLELYPNAKQINEVVSAVNHFSERLSIVERQQGEEARCPFSPLRNGEGKAALADIRGVRDEVAKLKTLIYALTAFMSGLGILQVWSLLSAVR